MTLEPVVVLVPTDRLAHLRSVAAAHPLPVSALTRTRNLLNGWTDEALILGAWLGSLATLHEAGEIDLNVSTSDA